MAKKGAKDVPVEPEGPSLTVSLRVLIDYSKDVPKDVFIRIISGKWATCVSSPLLNVGDGGWTISREPMTEDGEDGLPRQIGFMAASWEGNLSCTLHTDEGLSEFNEFPGIFAVCMSKGQESGEVPTEGVSPREAPLIDKFNPLDFAYVDCSSFLLNGGSVSGRTQHSSGISAEMKVTFNETIRPYDDLVPLQPMVFDFDSLGSYPRQIGENEQDTLDPLYIYAELPLGKGSSRFLFVRAGSDHPEPPPVPTETEGEDGIGEENINSPTDAGGEEDVKDGSAYNDDDANSDGQPEDGISFGLRSCFLAGLASIDLAKENFTSTTYTLEVHHDNVSKRAFHHRNIADFNSILRNADGAPTANAGDNEPGSAPGPSTPGDDFLVAGIKRAIAGSGLVRPHGVIRFRLEQLLASSVDLLTEFAKRRALLQEDEEPDNKVVVREDMMLEVRLSKPSKPQKWQRPSDISLRSALLRVEAEAQSRLDGTLAGSVQASTMGATSRHNKDPPRHEKFLSLNTYFVASAELHRGLEHPEKLPSVDEEVKERKIAQLIAADFDREPEPRTIAAELETRLSVTPYTRMVFVYKYNDDSTLMAINDTIVSINSRALPDIQGTLRSYSLSAEEVEAAKTAQLDIITGFSIIDNDARIVVMEGLAGPGQAMQEMFLSIPRISPNDSSLKILCNPEVLFPDRLYTEFGPDLKRIRVRDRLRKLARKPEIYNRYQVEEICFQSIDKVMALRRAIDLKSTKDLCLYPSSDSLNKLELLYGEAISRVDIDGSIIEEKRLRGLRTKSTNKKMQDFEQVVRRESQKSPRSPREKEEMLRRIESFAHTSSTTITNPRTLPTDSRNPEFEAHLANRGQAPDHLAENREIRKRAWEDALLKRANRDAEDDAYLQKILGTKAAEQGGKIFCYSSQAKNFKVLAFTEMRQRLAKFTSSTFTFSQEFVSQTVCIVDEDVDRKSIEAEKKSHWLTKSGFRYPLPKTAHDYIEHPKRPSDSRVEELREAFAESTFGQMPEEKKDAATVLLEKGYTTRIKGGNDFGKLLLPTFSREFELSLVGDKTKLPRGHQIRGISGDKDPNYNRSVFNAGDDGAAEEEAAVKAEKELWMSKVVVDDLAFKIGGFLIKDTPNPVERTRDILKDPPKRKELKFLRTRKSAHTGRDFSLVTPPFTIINVGEYKGNAGEKMLMRTSDKTKFITSQKLETGTGPDFIRFIAMNARVPKSQKLIWKRKAPPQDRNSAECTGPRWESAGN